MVLASEGFRVHVMNHDSPKSDDSRAEYSSEDEVRTRQFLTAISRDLGIPSEIATNVRFSGSGDLPSVRCMST
jgi:hypothetical protein